MKRAIDLRGAVAVNVITMIGIGPLVTIPLVLAALGGPLAMIGWIAGALVAMCDGLVWSELSSRLPGSGGTYVYLREAFGPERWGRAFAFLFNWQYLLFGPCVLASGYIGFANYAAYFVPAIASNPVAHYGVAAGVGVVTTLALYRATSRVAAVGTLLAVAAVVTLLAVAIAGLTHADFAQAFHLDGPVRFGSGLLAGFGSALVITLYDYVGYADVALLGDEVVRPERTIPRSIVLSVLIVAVLYIALQVGVLGVIPWHTLLDAHGNPTDASQYVGSLVVERTWGRTAAIPVTGLVLVTAFASLYGNLLGMSRIPYAAARDGAFLPAFARLDERRGIPQVSLFAIGGLSLVACLFTLDQVILFLTAGIVLVQGAAQVVALAALRRREPAAPFRMPLYPLPAIVALAGWLVAFFSTGTLSIGLALAWLLAGALIFALTAWKRRWWPFAAALALAALLPNAARAGDVAPQWSSWNSSAIADDHGYPVFAVDGKPFFVYGAAFFYERIPRTQWLPALQAYRIMGINTLDLYVIWNWHEPSAGVRDFTGSTDPRRDLRGLLQLAHALGFKLVLRPGPVIRNEWRNGGYPDWLLSRPEYAMPQHDILEGRYPATATLQNAHADAAAAEWLRNATHLSYAAGWLHDVLTEVAPYAHDVLAIALDDDQGAYIDNDTWPAPHWHAYVDWLRETVRATAGTRVPLFINTFDMKVPSTSPAWAWGDWYQSDAFRIGTHDLTQLDFATGLLQTQAHVPVMLAEFQAGWLQGADEAAPRPSDPSNTAIALNELLRDGAHGIVNFPVQDTIYPDGWEAPWANWSYAWNAALAYDRKPSPRYGPTADFGEEIERYGALLARTHVAADAAIVWPPSLFPATALTNPDFAAFADATMAMQRECARRRLACDLIDLQSADAATVNRYRTIVMPLAFPNAFARRMLPAMQRRIAALRREGRLTGGFATASLHPYLIGGRDATLLLADDGSYGFVDAINPSDVPRVIGPLTARLARANVTVEAIALSPHSAKLVPVGEAPLPILPYDITIATPPTPLPWARDTGEAHAFAAPLFTDGPNDVFMQNDLLRVAFAPQAGGRVALLEGPSNDNAATSIGLLRDAVDPEPSPSARDYIAAYTHPLPAGTFNRVYDCTIAPKATGSATVASASVSADCSYRAPDLPAGGARFTRTLSLDAKANALTVDETFAPNDESTAARAASISGFAFVPGDELIAPEGAPYIAILHGHRLAWIGWRPGDADATVRASRGTQIVTLVWRTRSVEFRLGVAPVSDAAEAQRLLQANPASRP